MYLAAAHIARANAGRAAQKRAAAGDAVIVGRRVARVDDAVEVLLLVAGADCVGVQWRGCAESGDARRGQAENAEQKAHQRNER